MTDYLSMLAPEELLLLRLCRLEFDEDQKKEIASLVAKVMDWNLFITLANDHGIIALCRYNLVNLGFSDIVPGDILKKLTESYLANVTRNTKIFRLLDKVLFISQGEGIEVVLLKGLALEMTLYGNVGLRQMNDLDILVKKSDAIRFRNLLLNNGFKSRPMMSPLHEKMLPPIGKHLPEMYKDGLSVEIHFKLFDEKGDSITEKFIKSSVPVSTILFDENFNPQNLNFKHYPRVRIPHPVKHFLYLVKHIQSHESEGIFQLRLYTDLFLLMKKIPDKDFLNIISEFSTEPIVDDYLYERIILLCLFWKFKGLSSGSEIIDSARLNEISISFSQSICNPKQINITEKEAEAILPIKALQTMTSLREKLSFIFGYVFPSISFMKWRYKLNSKIIAPVMYPVRWIRIIRFLIKWVV